VTLRPVNIVAVVFLARTHMSPLQDGTHHGPQVHRTGGSLGMSWGTQLVLDQRRHSVGTRSSSGAGRWSTTSTRGVLCGTGAQGLQRLLHRLLNVMFWGLGHLQGLTAHQGTLGRGIWINILRHSAQRFTNHRWINDEK
jgi:hypothetical protein